MCFTYSGFSVFPPPLDCKVSDSSNCCVFCSLLHPQYLGKYLAYSRWSINVQEWLADRSWRMAHPLPSLAVLRGCEAPNSAMIYSMSTKIGWRIILINCNCYVFKAHCVTNTKCFRCITFCNSQNSLSSLRPLLAARRRRLRGLRWLIQAYQWQNWDLNLGLTPKLRLSPTTSLENKYSISLHISIPLISPLAKG